MGDLQGYFFNLLPGRSDHPKRPMPFLKRVKSNVRKSRDKPVSWQCLPVGWPRVEIVQSVGNTTAALHVPIPLLIAGGECLEEKGPIMDASHEEFLAFTKQYRGIIVSAIRRICGASSHSLLPDVEQEVYLALWQRWKDDKRIDYPVSYLYKVALRTALAVIRASRAPDREGATTQKRSPTAQGSTIEDLTSAEQACLLTELLDRLPTEQARAVRAYLAGFSHTETATLYGWSAAVARHRIYRGLRALKTLVMQEAL